MITFLQRALFARREAELPDAVTTPSRAGAAQRLGLVRAGVRVALSRLHHRRLSACLARINPLAPLQPLRNRVHRPFCSKRILGVLCLHAGLLLAIGPVSPAQAETVRGTFTYQDIDPATYGSTYASKPRPIAFAKVEIWRCVPGFLGLCTWGNARTVWTDGNGSISEWFSHAASGTTYGVRVFATNQHVVVWPNDAAHTVPFHREPGEDSYPYRVINKKAMTQHDVLDFSYHFTGWSAQHYNIAETLRHGFAYANARRADSDALGAVNVQPTDASIGGTFYNAPVDTIVVESRHVFEDLLLLHEYAHFVEEQISTFAVIPSKHTGCDTNVGPPFGSPSELAWMEGFADYFAQAVASTLPSGTLLASPGTGTPSTGELESDCAGIDPAIRRQVELFVAAALWDLVDDTPNERLDFAKNRDREVFAIFDYELDQRLGHWPTIDDFYRAWTGRGLPRSDFGRNLPTVAGVGLLLDTRLADVTGDRKADLIAVTSGHVSVYRSTGTNFGSREDWSGEPFYGGRATEFADVTGDGRADAIAIWDQGIYVRRSTGTDFEPWSALSNWSHEPYYGSRATALADVTGDGRADAIAVNNDGVFVRRSTGTDFAPWTGIAWSHGPFYGGRATEFADVTGDGTADAIAIWDEGVYVRPSTGNEFAPWTGVSWTS